jgi:hypothetical protein
MEINYIIKKMMLQAQISENFHIKIQHLLKNQYNNEQTLIKTYSKIFT